MITRAFPVPGPARPREKAPGVFVRENNGGVFAKTWEGTAMPPVPADFPVYRLYYHNIIVGLVCSVNSGQGVPGDDEKKGKWQG